MLKTQKSVDVFQPQSSADPFQAKFMKQKSLLKERLRECDTGRTGYITRDQLDSCLSKLGE